MSNLALTYEDLYRITCEEFDRFEVLHNSIPNDGDPNSYIEDDGRQMRLFEFKDTETGLIYNFSFVWHGEYGYDFPSSMFNVPKGIDIVSESIINPEKEPEIKAVDVPKVSDHIGSKLMNTYLELEHDFKDFDDAKDQIPVSAFDDAFALLKTKKFTINDIRAVVIPICLKYKVKEKSTWTYIQKTRGAWV